MHICNESRVQIAKEHRGGIAENTEANLQTDADKMPAKSRFK
jgi:hypothetical protein